MRERRTPGDKPGERKMRSYVRCHCCCSWCCGHSVTCQCIVGNVETVEDEPYWVQGPAATSDEDNGTPGEGAPQPTPQPAHSRLRDWVREMK